MTPYLQYLTITPCWQDYPDLKEWLVNIDTAEEADKSVTDQYKFIRLTDSYQCYNITEKKAVGNFDSMSQGLDTLLGYYLQPTSFSFDVDVICAMAESIAKLRRGEYAFFAFHYLAPLGSIDVDTKIHSLAGGAGYAQLQEEFKEYQRI